MKTLYKLSMFLVFLGTFYFLGISLIPSGDGTTGIGNALSFDFKETATVGIVFMVWGLLFGIISPIVVKVLCLTHVMKDEDFNSSKEIIKRIVLTSCTVGVLICLYVFF